MGKLLIRLAKKSDLPNIVRLLADDILGKTRERYQEPLPLEYKNAFAEINADPNNLLIVAEIDGKIVGTLQLTFLIHLACLGGRRALIEGVRVHKNYRGQGIGKRMLERCIKQARERNCYMVELTTNKIRTGAFQFYKKLGFVPSHEGMKFDLATEKIEV